MTASSADQSAIARSSSQLLLQALAKCPLDRLALALAKDETTACRVRSGESRITLAEACALIDAADMKLVARDRVCVDRKKYEALATIAAAAMSDPESAKKLVWDDEQ